MLSFWYSNSYIRMKLGLEKLSEPVKLKRGLRQGSVLSPILFSTLTSKVTKQISDGLRFDTCDLSLISYADDLLMLSFSLSVLQDNLDELVSGYSAIGLQVNGEKTKFLVFSSAKQEAPAPTVSVDGAIIAPSSSLIYLGLRYGRDKKTTRTLCIDTLVILAALSPIDFLKRILAKADSLELSIHICSVDISAAFDSLIQSAVFHTLLDAGVNAHIVAMLSFWYSNSYIRMKLGLEKLSEPVKLKRGLRQGSVLSPILFSTLTSKVTKQISDGLRFDTCDLSLISYADDLLMLSFSLSVLQDNLDELVSGYSAIGLQVNGEKTKFLVFSSAKQEAPAPTVSVDGAIIAPSSSLIYLGLRYGRDKKTTRTLCIDTLVKGFSTENEENNQYFIESVDSRIDSVQKPMIIINQPEYHQDITYKIDTGVDANNPSK
ncbi:hypothetical protein QYM36_001750 [Artemia franciscana]|uniref:Reverse transcriptase domain-containing protein n=1 Tax=Artemia franciscana TaxID=6661 RepID=A0AA88LE54_ARTSF|nr:hypothetical protein QYM36_001750 [Artemia franciscana]